MALALKLREGQRVYVGDTRVQLIQILGPMKFKIEVQRPAINEQYTITDKMGTKILPNVVVSAGLNEQSYESEKYGSQYPELSVKLLFTAPREIEILREHLYWARKREADAS